MNPTLEAPKSGLAAVKQRQQPAWASGDYAAVGARIVLAAELLCDTADLHAGWRVLDVATGSGNAAIAAARHGCIGRRRRLRARAARARPPARRRRGARVELLEGDAEALPFAKASFDAVTSVFGCMFAPDHAQTAAELLRVCRPGGTIALASWTPEGFIGELFRTIGAHVPPPAGVPSPMLWGTEAHLRILFGDGISSLEVAERTFTFRFTSAEEFASFFRTWYGPTLKAFEALEAPARDALEADLVELARQWDRLDSDAIAIPGDLHRGGRGHALSPTRRARPDPRQSSHDTSAPGVLAAGAARSHLERPTKHTKEQIPMNARVSIAQSGRKAALVAAAGVLAVILGAAAPAGDAFPGSNGKIAYAGYDSTSYNIWVMNADGSGRTYLTSSLDWETDPTFSPDGSKIAYTRGETTNANDIWVMNANGTGQTNLTPGSGQDGEATWSPDGSKIAFESTRGGDWDIWVMNADGSGQTNLTPGPVRRGRPGPGRRTGARSPTGPDRTQQRRDLRHERRRLRSDEPDPEPEHRHESGLVARREQDRVRDAPPVAGLRDERGRLRPDEPEP